jgi:hypothetical protein
MFIVSGVRGQAQIFDRFVKYVIFLYSLLQSYYFYNLNVQFNLERYASELEVALKASIFAVRTFI